MQVRAAAALTGDGTPADLRNRDRGARPAVAVAAAGLAKRTANQPKRQRPRASPDPARRLQTLTALRPAVTRPERTPSDETGVHDVQISHVRRAVDARALWISGASTGVFAGATGARA